MSNRLPVLAAMIREAHDAARIAARFSAERAIEAGNLLIEAKATIGHGHWLPWLKQHVGVSERTAQGYMRIARLGLKSATVADLGLRATLVRLGRRKAKLPHFRPGTYMRLINGPEVTDELRLDSLSGRTWHETELHLWSRNEDSIECLWFWAPDMSWHPRYDGKRHIIGAHLGQPSPIAEVRHKVEGIFELEEFTVLKLIQGSDLCFLNRLLSELPAPTSSVQAFNVE
jgi:hypothetical protein